MLEQLDARKFAKNNILENKAFVLEQSIKIEEKFLKDFSNENIYFIYLASPLEVQTDIIIKRLLELKKTICVPKIVNGEMVAVKINEDTQYQVDKWGILEPISEEVIDIIDICVTPLVAFHKMARIGHGKGYYDKFFTKHNCKKIALAFSWQEVDEFKLFDHDILMDDVIVG